MNIALWVIQVFLAVAFLASGLGKVARPRLALVDRTPYVEDFSDAQIKGIGTLELFAAVGLVVPPLIHFATFLTPLAAVGIVLLMIGAAVTHLRRHEPQLVAFNAVLLVLAAVVAIGRFGPYPL
jgi:uncharacterized membrane protein YphA (DoxX/SURF4 family)